MATTYAAEQWKAVDVGFIVLGVICLGRAIKYLGDVRTSDVRAWSWFSAGVLCFAAVLFR